MSPLYILLEHMLLIESNSASNMGSLKYGFCKELLRYKWTSDQLNTFGRISTEIVGDKKFRLSLMGSQLDFLWPITPSIAEILCVKNVEAIVVCAFLMNWLKKNPENMKKPWEPFGSYLLNSTANPAQFEWKWPGLAVLFSR